MFQTPFSCVTHLYLCGFPLEALRSGPRYLKVMTPADGTRADASRCRPDERGGRGGQRPGARVSGGPGRKAKTPLLAKLDFFFFDRKSVHGGSRILIRGGPPKKNVGLATLGMM